MIPPRYDFGNIKLWVGDSKEVLSTFPDNTVHLIVTSPPYYIRTGLYSSLEEDLENAPTWEEYVEKLCGILTECARVLVPGGKMCINIADSWTNLKREKVNKCLPTHAYIIVHLEKNCGLLYKGSFIYTQIRHHHASGGALFLLGSFPYPPNIPICNFFEYILVFQKRGKYKAATPSPEVKEMSKLGKEGLVWCATGVWQVTPNRQRDPCPAPFPPEIPYRLIRLFSFVGDIVLDPFVGSGVAIKMAARLGRQAWGIDINPHYIEHIRKEIEEDLFLSSTPHAGGGMSDGGRE